MTSHLRNAIAAIALPALVVGCNATGEERAYDTTRPSSMTPTPSAPPDSTTGVARSSGRPGVAGDTISRSSDVSAPPGKTPDPKRP
jgi:hypothetical protein